jgi:ferredoxin-type protein NapG
MKKNTQTQQNTAKLSRRQFLQLGIPVGLMLALGFTTDQLRHSPAPLRPPGGQEEEKFLSTCIQCYRCIDACPQNIVQMINLQDDLGRARTPTLDFSQGFCDFCMDCVQACPTGALGQPETPTPALGIAEIDKTACIAWSWMGCTVCFAHCPYEAIALDANGRPYVIPQ